MNGPSELPLGIYQSLCCVAPQNNDSKHSLTQEQQKEILSILKRIDLTIIKNRRSLIAELKNNPRVTNLVHQALFPTQDPQLVTFDHELLQSVYRNLQDILDNEDVDKKSVEADQLLTEYNSFFYSHSWNEIDFFDLFSLFAFLEQTHPGDVHDRLLLQKLSDETNEDLSLIISLEKNCKEVKEFIDSLNLLSPFSYVFIAHYISSKKTPISHLAAILSEEQLTQLAPYLRYGDFRDMESDLVLKLINETTNLQHLFINQREIEELKTSLPFLRTLDCSHCENLKLISEDFYSLSELNCSYCPLLKSIPIDMPFVEKLNTSRCPLLEKPPQNVPLLKYFICSHCSLFETLPEAPNLVTLLCGYCPQLVALPRTTQSLTTLNCTNCPRLTRLPHALPVIRTLNCTYCNSLNGDMPEIPQNAIVFTRNSPLEFTKMVVDIKQIASEPKQILLQLGQKYLLKGKQFPNIYYQQEDQKFEAVDTGGVRRDLIVRIMETIFTASKLDKVRLPLDHGGTPIADEEADTKDAYLTLGKIFALCYEPESLFKVGQLLDEEVYRRIACMPGEELDSISYSDMVSLYQKYMNMPVEVAQFINANTEGETELDEWALTNLDSLLGLIESDANAIEIEDSQKFLKKTENKALLKAAIKNEILVSENFRALNFIAMGMKSSMDVNEWADFQKLSETEIIERIEGTLSHEEFINKIKWSKSDSVSQADLLKAENFIYNWVARANLEKLRQLVRAITSNNTLSQNSLNIEVYSRGQDFIPAAHTCFSTLELSHEYQSQEQFDQKLELLLTEGMAEGGFQVA